MQEEDPEARLLKQYLQVGSILSSPWGGPTLLPSAHGLAQVWALCWPSAPPPSPPACRFPFAPAVGEAGAGRAQRLLVR